MNMIDTIIYNFMVFSSRKRRKIIISNLRAKINIALSDTPEINDLRVNNPENGGDRFSVIDSMYGDKPQREGK